MSLSDKISDESRALNFPKLFDQNAFPSSSFVGDNYFMAHTLETQHGKHWCSPYFFNVQTDEGKVQRN